MGCAGWPRLSRRRFLAGGAALGVTASLGLTAAQEDAERTLRLLCWEGYDDPAATEGFREATGWAIAADYLRTADEIFTLLRAGGIGRYDLVSPPNGLVAPLADAGLIQPLDPSRLGNAAALFPRFQQPDWAMVSGQTFAAPLVWGTCPLIYNADLLEVPPAAWTDLGSAAFAQKVVLTDDPLGHFRIWNRVRGHDDPTRVSRNELDQTADLLVELKRTQVIDFVSAVPAAAEVLASGAGWVSATGWESAPTLPEAEGADLRLARPAPGDWSFCDSWCLATGAPHVDAAYSLIDHMLSAQAQAALMRRLHRGTVNAEAVDLLDDDLRGLFQYDDLDEVFGVSPLVGYPPLQDEGNGIATYVDWINAWDRVRVAPLLSQIEPTATATSDPTRAYVGEPQLAPRLDWPPPGTAGTDAGGDDQVGR